MRSATLRNDLFRGVDFLVENAVEHLIETCLVGQKRMELFQISGIVAPRNPDFKIAFRAVFIIEVPDRPLIMSGSVKIVIIGQPILDCATDYCLRIYEAVGFGNE